ncbi:hypothetical protein [Mycolicibacterium mageritense]|uniref:hypothetical protein n=1 Tax=Mycolicibacterium mageritense TaxID=53462 RepID=UPI001E631E2E|nr:hypothetical protein [Mycolicibacterium mageritense]GJJ24110.1 hypothetical protein MTY414_77840 [Mycolicibacterium mageritense]
MAKQTHPADFYVAFGGNHGQVGVDEPALGQQVEYTVFGTVSKVAEAIRDDGETRTTVSVDVEAAWPKGSRRPDAANQPAMVDHEGNVTPEAAGEDEEPAGELIDTTDEDGDGESNVVSFSDSK